MGLLIGIDGGGTSSRIRICGASDSRQWEAKGEGVNPNAVGLDTAVERLAQGIDLGLKALGATVGDIDSIAAGLAGVGRPQEIRDTEAALRLRLGYHGRLWISTDAEIALVGGLDSLEGILLIAGTGSIALGRSREGSLVRAGGLGHFLGDEGSAFYLGFEALRRALRSLEGRDLATSLMPGLLDRFGLAKPEEAIPFIYTRFDKALVASAASVVLESWKGQDPLATDIVEGAWSELAALVSSVLARSPGSPGREREMVLWGGLVEGSPDFKAGLARKLKTACPGARVVEPRGTALDGALKLARG